MKPAMTVPIVATLLLWTLGVPGASAQGVSVSVGGGVSVSTGGSSTSTGSTNSGVESTLKSVTGGTSEQEQALAAVKSQHALSLDKIMAAARQYTDGEIIDAQLITARGFLLYDLKVLDTKGDVADLYFYAQSGKIVETK